MLKFHSRSLRSKLIAVSLILALLPLLLMALINLRSTYNALTNSAHQSLLAAASKTAVSLDMFIDTNLSALRVEAGIPAFVRYLNQQATGAIDPTVQANAFEALTSLSRKDTINIFSYALLDLKGRNLLDTYTPATGQDESKQDYFKQVMETELPYVSTVQDDLAFPGRYSLYFSSLVRSAAGQVIGVLRMAYSATVIQQLVTINNGLVGKESYGLLLNEDTVRLAHGTKPDLIFQPLSSLSTDRIKQLQALGQLPKDWAIAPNALTPNLKSHLANATAQPFFTLRLAESGNRQMTIAMAPLQYRPWTVLFTEPEATFLAPVQRQTQNILWFSLLAAGLVTSVAVAIARRLTNPLVYLTRKVSQFASGDLNVVANVRSNDEIGALAGSFNQMAHQLRESFTNLERANEELETRVEQRTRELREANDRITQLNTQLQTENLRLGAELDVARQLQRMILPREEELRSVVPLEIAGFMEPADEVGGDYYDVLQHDGKVVIGIGDVTGHGLESGVVMIMAQTAVRALTAVNEADPVKFLNALNHTIYANTQRMKSGKNMTLSLMEYKNGAIYVTGQHEDIIIVRQDGDVENVDTFDLGFPLGIESDISAYITQTEIRLQPGDIAVMYTDGITEATSPDQKLYGLEPLYDVLKRYRHCSANEIRQAVIQDVRRHIGTQKLFDDITLVVIKQKQEATAQS